MDWMTFSCVLAATLAGNFIFSILRYKKAAKTNEELLHSLDTQKKENNHLQSKINSLSSEHERFKAQTQEKINEYEQKLKEKEQMLDAVGVQNLNLTEQIKNLRWTNPNKTQFDSDDSSVLENREFQEAYNSAQKEIRKLKQENAQLVKANAQLSQENVSLDDQLDDLTFQKDELEKKLNLAGAKMLHHSIAELRKYTWGEILQRHSNTKYVLSDKDRLSIRYPPLHPDCVFYAPNTGTRYHSVEWCYSLDAAAGRIRKCTLEEAKEKKFIPCSKCVDEEHDKQYSNHEYKD